MNEKLKKGVQTCTPNPCQNGGTCEDFNNSNITCICAPNYTGLQCEQGF